MGEKSILARLNHPVVWATAALAGAGAIYYFKIKTDTKDITDPETAVAEDPNAHKDQVVQEEKLFKVQMTLEDFNCISLLGRGSFGKVLLGEYRKTQELFAIKAIKKRDILNYMSVAQLICEQKVLELVTRANHPFLIHMFACFQTELHTCFVLEYAAGGDLLTHSGNGAFSKSRTVFYSACAVLGIEFLHWCNIAHGDIKLDNMLLDAEGYMKISDFGYCKEEADFKNVGNFLASTTDYLALNYTGRVADWWALGTCIYEMLTTKAPLYAYDSKKTHENLLGARIIFPKFLSKEAVGIIRKLTFRKNWCHPEAVDRGAEIVKRHCFFRDMPWDDLLARKIKPPWVPTIKDCRDVSNFSYFTAGSPQLTPPRDPTALTREEQLLFEGFDIFFPLRERKAAGAESLVSG